MGVTLDVSVSFETIVAIRAAKNIDDAVEALSKGSQANRAIGEGARAIVKAIRQLEYDITPKKPEVEVDGSDAGSEYTPPESQGSWLTRRRNNSGWGSCHSPAPNYSPVPSPLRGSDSWCNEDPGETLLFTVRDAMMREERIEMSSNGTLWDMAECYSRSINREIEDFLLMHKSSRLDLFGPEVTLGRAGIKDGDVIMAHPNLGEGILSVLWEKKLGKKISFTVHNSRTGHHNFQMRNKKTIGNLAYVYSERIHRPCSKHDFEHKGVFLREDWTLEDCSIEDGDVIIGYPKAYSRTAISQRLEDKGWDSGSDKYDGWAAPSRCASVASQNLDNLSIADTKPVPYLEEVKEIVIIVRDEMQHEQRVKVFGDSKVLALSAEYSASTGKTFMNFDFYRSGEWSPLDPNKTLQEHGIKHGDVLTANPAAPKLNPATANPPIQAAFGWAYNSSVPLLQPPYPNAPQPQAKLSNLSHYEPSRYWASITVYDCNSRSRALEVDLNSKYSDLLRHYRAVTGKEGGHCSFTFLNGREIVPSWDCPTLREYGIAHGTVIVYHEERQSVGGWD